jgi:hypothetical protein
MIDPTKYKNTLTYGRKASEQRAWRIENLRLLDLLRADLEAHFATAGRTAEERERLWKGATMPAYPTVLYLRDSSTCCGGFAGGTCELCEEPEARRAMRCTTCGGSWVLEAPPKHLEGCHEAPDVGFLDVDGVLNHEGTYAENARLRPGASRPEHWIDPACVHRLNHLGALTGMVFVLSSGWRTFRSIPGQPFGGLRGTLGVLRACGLSAPLVSATPDLVTRAEAEETPRRVWGDRGAEIRAWLGRFPARAWVVLDDQPIHGIPALHLVQTRIAVGLTDEDVERAVASHRAQRGW